MSNNNKIILNSYKYISDKNIDYRMYLALASKSYYKEEWNATDYKVLNSDDFFNSKECFLKSMSITNKRFNTILNNILKSDLVLYEDEDLKIKVKENGINFTILTEEEIEKLLTLTSNEIKTYIIIKKYIGNNSKEKNIKISFIAEQIGLSIDNASKIIKKILNKLEDKKLIEYNIKPCQKIEGIKKISYNSYYFKIITFP